MRHLCRITVRSDEASPFQRSSARNPSNSTISRRVSSPPGLVSIFTINSYPIGIELFVTASRQLVVRRACRAAASTIWGRRLMPAWASSGDAAHDATEVDPTGLLWVRGSDTSLDELITTRNIENGRRARLISDTGGTAKALQQRETFPDRPARREFQSPCELPICRLAPSSRYHIRWRTKVRCEMTANKSNVIFRIVGGRLQHHLLLAPKSILRWRRISPRCTACGHYFRRAAIPG
jgi:hypothetical protein